MKEKIILLIILFLHFSIVMSQNNNFCFVYNTNETIPVYNSYNDSVTSYFLYKDTLKENYYSLQIEENNNNRFLVNIFENNTLIHKGWIEKKYCYVWCWLMSTQSIYLFNEADTGSSHIELSENELIQHRDGIIANILDYDKGSFWVKLLLKTKTATHIGWTLNYCGSIYGSCEGERATTPSHVYGFEK